MQNFVTLYEFGVRNEQKYEISHVIDLKGDTSLSQEVKSKIQNIIIQARRPQEKEVSFYSYSTSSDDVDDSEMDNIIGQAFYAFIIKANGVSINQ